MFVKVDTLIKMVLLNSIYDQSYYFSFLLVFIKLRYSLTLLYVKVHDENPREMEIIQPLPKN